VDGIACGAVVSAVKTDKGLYYFDAVVARGGNSTHRLWLADELTGKSEDVLRNLRNLGCRAEVTLGRLIAVDASPVLEERVREFLLQGKQKRLLGVAGRRIAGMKWSASSRIRSPFRCARGRAFFRSVS
jgi:hypothetical protein